MKVLVAPASGRLEVGEAPVPSIGPEQVLVRTMVSGVSAGTETRKLFTADLGPNDVRAPWPAIGGFGYMAAGLVEAVGADVRNVAPGDRVYAGRVWGGHRELIDTEAASVVRLPTALGWLEAACSYWAVPPLLGLLGVQHLARLARRVVALDPIAERRDLALELGAAGAVDPRGAGAGAADAVRTIALDLPDVVLEVSGTQPGLEAALAIVRPRGRIALIGSQQRLDRFDLFWPLQNSGAQIVPLFREGEESPQTAAGSPTQRYVPLIHEMLLRGQLQIQPLISWVVSPEVAPRAMDLLHRRPDLAVGMAIAWDPVLVRDNAAVERAWAEDTRQRALSVR